jgi:trk system potassium uptake protein TrkA
LAEHPDTSPILVLGLGRFGSALARTLIELGHEVLAVDRDPARVQQHAAELTHVAEADTTSEEALRQLGAADFDRAIVAIGSHIEASILTTSTLVDIGVRTVWAKAITRSHGRILTRVGASRVIFPEHDMGQRVAHLLSGRLVNYIEFEDGFALVETEPPASYVGLTLGEAGIRSRHGVTVVCVKRPGQDFTYATPETRIEAGDLLIVAGETRLAERFAALE